MLWFIQQFPKNQSHVLQKNAESFGSMLIMELHITDLTHCLLWLLHPIFYNTVKKELKG